MTKSCDQVFTTRVVIQTVLGGSFGKFLVVHLHQKL